THSGVPRGLYDSFTSPTDASLTGLSLVLSGLSGSAGSITIGLFANSANTPGSLLATLGTLNDPQTTTIQLYAITLGSNPALSAGARYWIGISSSNFSAIDWADQNHTNTSGTGVVGEFFTVDASTFSNGTGNLSGDGAFKMQITTTATSAPAAAPEPSSI